MFPIQHGSYVPATSWDPDTTIYVLDNGIAVELHFGVKDDQLDELLAHIAGGVVLPRGQEPCTLTVVRVDAVLGHVYRRPGLPSTYTNLLRPRAFGLVEPSVN